MFTSKKIARTPRKVSALLTRIAERHRLHGAGEFAYALVSKGSPNRVGVTVVLTSADALNPKYIAAADLRDALSCIGVTI